MSDQRIIGKMYQYLVCIGLMIAIMQCVASDITLEIMDVNKRPLQQAQVGVPFLLEISFEGNGNKPVSIEGLDQFHNKCVRTYRMTVNNRATTSYTYELRADKVGTYTIGPALVMRNHGPEQSNVITIVVAHEQQFAKEKKKTVYNRSKSAANREKASVIVRLSIDKEKVYVGEKVKLTLRIYTTQHDLSVRRVLQDQIDGIVMKNVINGNSGEQVIDEKRYYYTDISWDIYAQKPGEKIIPAYGIEYEIPSETEDVFSSLFGMRFSRMETKQAYSNALELEVLPLPVSDIPVNAIGKFNSFKASVAPAVARQAEGITFTLDLEGEGNLEDISFPELTQIPETFKYYQSKMYMLPTKNESIKRFEYILQGLEAGEWEIPAQEFVYFDTAVKRYRRLKTMPQMVKITPNPTAHKVLQENNEKKDETVLVDRYDDEIVTIHTNDQWMTSSFIFPLSWKQMIGIHALFFALIILLIIYWYNLDKDRSHPSYRMKKSVKKALRLLAQAEKNNAAESVYYIMMNFIADRSGKDFAQIDDTFVTTLLSNSTIDMHAWRSFFETMQAVTFAHKSVYTPELVRNAQYWISILKEIV